MLIALALTTLSTFARDCGPQLTPTPPARVSLDAAIDLVAMLLPAESATEFHAMSVRVRELPIEATDGRARLRYRSRFFDWRVRRAKTARVLWNDRAPTTTAEREDLIAATIDLVSEANFTPVRRTSIYLRRPRTFTSDNLEVIQRKMLWQLFTLGPPTTPPAPLKPFARIVRTALRPLLPTQFAVIRGARLTTAHVDIFLEDGPAGLYQHLRRSEGTELALRYWYTHVTNVQGVLTAAYMASIAPAIFETWRYVFNLHLVPVDDHATGTARTLLRAMRQMPAQVIENGRRIFEGLPVGERRALTRLYGAAI